MNEHNNLVRIYMNINIQEQLSFQLAATFSSGVRNVMWNLKLDIWISWDVYTTEKQWKSAREICENELSAQASRVTSFYDQ